MNDCDPRPPSPVFVRVNIACPAPTSCTGVTAAQSEDAEWTKTCESVGKRPQLRKRFGFSRPTFEQHTAERSVGSAERPRLKTCPQTRGNATGAKGCRVAALSPGPDPEMSMTVATFTVTMRGQMPSNSKMHGKHLVIQ